MDSGENESLVPGVEGFLITFSPTMEMKTHLLDDVCEGTAPVVV